MDRNELLASTRAEFFRSFLDGVESSMQLSIEGLFKKADRSSTSLAQRRYLDARSVLQNQVADLRHQMQVGMEKMLNRSFQTTYSNYRPLFPTSILDGSVSLVDTSAFEDELRFNKITERFRDDAGEQLRDLNIRIALLFEQDNIKERENPFRPYLFSRTLAMAVENLGKSADLNTVLTEQLAEKFSDCVAGIYGVVNAHLARHGIAAQLLLKTKRSTSAPPSSADVSADREPDEEIESGYVQNPPLWNSGGRNQYDIDKREISTDVPKNPVEQLLNSVKAMASSLYRPTGDSDGMSQTDRHARPEISNGGSQARGNAAGTYSGGISQGGGNANGGVSAGMPPTGEATGSAGDTDDMQPPGRQSSEGGDSHSKAGWISGKQVIGDVLRKFFSGTSAPDDFAGGSNDQFAGDSGNAGHAGGQLANSVQNLLRQSTPQTEEMFGSDGEVRNLIMERRSALNDMARGVKEQMTIDIIAMLFEFILRDTQVPAEVRAQLGRLQFLVLKVALRDNSLLTQKAHPARMLVNRIGSISLGLKQIEPSGASVTAEISRIVAALLADETENPGLFSKMLDDLDAFIAHEMLVNDKNVTRAVEVVEQAESRTLRFAHTTAQMSEALSGLTISGPLKNFLESDWVRAIELAERTNTKLASRYRLLVPDLLWSVLPKVNEDDRAQLLILLPIILKTIHEGMNSVGWEVLDKQTLMDWLFNSHTLVLRGSNANVPATTLSLIHEHFKKFVENSEMSPQTTYAGGTPADHKSFLEAAMQELDVRIQLLDQLFDQDKDLPEEAAAADAHSRNAVQESEPSIAERLRIGVVIEVNLGGTPSIGRLNWINPNASNLVLTLNDQTEPSMISVRMFQRLLKHGRVRFLEKEPIFERAVQSLLISANQVD